MEMKASHLRGLLKFPLLTTVTNDELDILLPVRNPLAEEMRMAHLSVGLSVCLETSLYPSYCHVVGVAFRSFD